MDQDQPHAHELEEQEVAHDRLHQGLVEHGAAPVFDDDGFTGKALNVRNGLDENFRPGLGINEGARLRIRH